VANNNNTTTGNTTTIGDDNAPLGGIEGEQQGDDDDAIAISDSVIPKEALSKSKDSWSLSNLILAIITGLITVALFILYIIGRKKDEEEEGEELKRRGIMWLLSFIPTVAAIVTFILTQDMSRQMMIADGWTWLMAVIVVIQIILAVLTIKKREVTGR
jgi:cytochrome bd-type quinol oxidase subunit 2